MSKWNNLDKRIFEIFKNQTGIDPVILEKELDQKVRIQLGEYIWIKSVEWIQQWSISEYSSCDEMATRMLNFYYINKYGKPFNDRWVEGTIIPMGPGSSIAINKRYIM